ncbi:MAG: 5' nucleotidase, NT5C type [Acidimicrobiales bacterium]
MRSPTEFILGVDLDGVCADYTRALRDVVATSRGVDPEGLPLDHSWDFGEWGVRPDEFSQLHQEAVLEHRIFRTMPPVPGAADALWRLSDAGIWIRIITHRLYGNWGHAIAVGDTVAWLDSVGIPYRDLCFLGAKPQVEADCYVEDAPHNIAALRDRGAFVVIFDRFYNRSLPGQRAADWAEVEDQVGAQVAAAGLALQAALPGFEDAPHRVQRRTSTILPDPDPDLL